MNQGISATASTAWLWARWSGGGWKYRLMSVQAVVCAVLVMCVTVTPAAAQAVLGSGSTLCFPVMAKWIEAYGKAKGAEIQYQPIGSAAGMIEVRHDVVNFAVSEAPLDDAQLLRDGLAQFPLVIGGIMPVVNLDAIAAGQLHLTGALLADIFLGKVTKWTDPAIAALNPGLNLPDLRIQVVHRSDGSGTTFVWADYLSKVSNEWKAKVGESTIIAWPTGFGGKGNSGLAEKVSRLRGAIGYVDYAYARSRKLAYALVQNRAGNFVTPGIASFEVAAEGAPWRKEQDFDVLLTDAPAANAYPIVATSFVLVRKYPADRDRARAMMAFFRWTLENGQDLATAQDSVALPPPLVQQIESYWENPDH